MISLHQHLPKMPKMCSSDTKTTTTLYLHKFVIPHNGAAINGKLLSIRSLGVHSPNLDPLEGLIGECDQVEDIVPRYHISILIKKYFFPGTIVKVDVSQKRVKLDWSRKKGVICRDTVQKVGG